MIKLLERLQEEFSTMESDGLTKISIGVATGADKAYIVPEDAAIDVEPERLTPIVMADDIRAGQSKTPTKMLLNPWDSDGKLVAVEQYPKFTAVLSSQESVKKRFVAQRNPLTWHRTIDKVYPGLAERPKLLLQDMKAQITPALELGGLLPAPHPLLHRLRNNIGSCRFRILRAGQQHRRSSGTADTLWGPMAEKRIHHRWNARSAKFAPTRRPRKVSPAGCQSAGPLTHPRVLA